LIKRAHSKPILVVDSLRDFPFGEFKERCTIVEPVTTIATLDLDLNDEEDAGRTAYTMTISSTHLRALQAKGLLKEQRGEVLFKAGGMTVIRLCVLLTEQEGSEIMSAHSALCQDLREQTTLSLYETELLTTSELKESQVTLKQAWLGKDYADRQLNAVKLASALFFAHAGRGVMSFSAGADVRMTLRSPEEKGDVLKYVKEVGFEGFVAKVAHDVHNTAWKTMESSTTTATTEKKTRDVIDVTAETNEDTVVIRTIRLEDDKTFHAIAARYGIKIGAIQGHCRAYGTCPKNTVLRGGTKIATSRREVAYLHRIEDLASEQDGGDDV
jgi:hypothetical protein